MQIVLSDHNCEGQARALFDLLKRDGIWLQLVPMELKWFYQLNLSIKADDETVWRFCQERGYLLLTGNRRADDGEKSLEFVMRRLLTTDSLPVITISNLRRVDTDPAYCRACAEKLAVIVEQLDRYRGITRLYLP